MSNVFNLKRALNYFLYDLKCAKGNYLYSLLILGMMPVVAFALSQLSCLIIEGRIVEFGTFFQGMMIFVSVAVLLISFPIKHYGKITEKKYGSAWLMIPASTFEKWLSMILICCVVLPILFGTLFIASDFLMSVIFPNYYPSALVSSGSFFSDFANLFDSMYEEVGVKFDMTDVSISNWCQNVLIMLLGAIVFKRAKFAKTALALGGIAWFIILVCVLILGIDYNLNDSDIERWLGSWEEGVLIDRINLILNAIYALFFILLSGGIYLRIKNLKH